MSAHCGGYTASPIIILPRRMANGSRCRRPRPRLQSRSTGSVALIKDGILPAGQVMPGAPYQIRASDLHTRTRHRCDRPKRHPVSRRSGKPTCNVYRRLKRRGTMNGSSQRSAIPGYLPSAADSRARGTAISTGPKEPSSRPATVPCSGNPPPPHRAGNDPVPKPPSPPARPSPPESSGPARAARSRSGRTRCRQQTEAPRPSCGSFSMA